MYHGHLHDIFQSTVGIIFFGTPHWGADPRGFLQRVAEAVAKAAGFCVNEEIANTLVGRGERLRELLDEFNPLAYQQQWPIHSFQEQYGVKALNGKKVVEDTSSCLNFPTLEITEHIASNHMDMCRFSSLENVQYKKVAGSFKRILQLLSKPTFPTTGISLARSRKERSWIP
ncbi:hypothetical protein VTN77DRAFT_7295 [Rasamsonia byssochlamydoides]|uniref:uncharacterized protein n=1 Tax=Rasamsonia byssochlamydoides TaxID=89139 RepID=UPI00374312B7